jgi:hypothetical protein
MGFTWTIAAIVVVMAIRRSWGAMTSSLTKPSSMDPSCRSPAAPWAQAVVGLGLVGERQDDPTQHGMGLTDPLLPVTGQLVALSLCRSTGLRLGCCGR